MQTTSRNSETTRRRLCCEKLGTLPLVQFWRVLLLKERMMTSVRKTFKTLVWSAQNRSISNEVFPENNHKIGLFWPIDFRLSLPRKFLRNRSIFLRICPYKSREIWLFFRDLSEALHSMVRSIRFENIVDRGRYKFGGKLALFMLFGTFFMMKAKQDKMKCLLSYSFNLNLNHREIWSPLWRVN